MSLKSLGGKGEFNPIGALNSLVHANEWLTGIGTGFVLEVHKTVDPDPISSHNRDMK